MAQLKDLTHGQAPLFGGKAVTLGEMIRSGSPVPPGYALSVEDYNSFLSFNRFPFAVEEYLAKNDKIVDFLLNAAIPPDMRRSLGRAYAELIELSPDRLLAVRSSAVCEDDASHSMAGVFESYIDVASLEDLERAVRRCYASLFKDRALAHAVRNELAWENLTMGVVIQPFIAGRPSGVLFTADAVEMDPEVLIVNAVDGICADYVRGGRPASLFRLEKSSGRLIQSTVPDKAPRMDERALGMLKEAGARIERLFHSHQDVEWTIRAVQLYILQARPITTFREPRFPTAWDNDHDASSTWTLDAQYPFTPLQQEIVLLANEGNNQGADATGLSQYYWDFMFQNGYKYYKPREMHEAEKKRTAFFQKMMELFKEGRNIFQDFVLVRLDEYREKLDGYVRTAGSPTELMLFIEEALEYLCESRSLHWQAVWGRGPVDSGTPDFQRTFKEYFEEKIGALSVPDYYALVFRQSRLARNRELILMMAGLVDGTPVLKALFQDHPFDEVLYPKLAGSEEGRILLGKIEGYLEEFGLISFDPFRDSTFPPLMRDRPSAVLGWVRSSLGQDIGQYEDRLKETLRNKEGLAAQILARLTEQEKKEFPGMLALAEKAFLVSDDHAFHVDLMQHAYLNIALKRAGRWLSANSLVGEPGDVFFLRLNELKALLRGAGSVSSQEIQGRKAAFQDWRRMNPPAFLGKPPQRAEDSEEPRLPPLQIIKGVSGLRKKAQGKVRVPKIGTFTLEEKCIPVLPEGHSCYIEPYLAHIVGLVYDGGSPFDHPGIIAREMDIPAIYYTRDATRRLKDGEMVELDGFAGEVRILSQ